MGNLDDILSKKIKQLGIERQVDAVGVVEKAQKEIAKYIPEDDFEVVSYKNYTLKISVQSAAVASEISGHKNEILKKTQAKYLNLKIT